MNEEIKSPITSDAVTEQDKGRCAQAPGSAAAWKKFYDAELAEHERLARKYHEAGDTHGWNFHKGVASGLIKADIHMQQNK